jgi:hypothetical protein
MTFRKSSQNWDARGALMQQRFFWKLANREACFVFAIRLGCPARPRRRRLSLAATVPFAALFIWRAARMDKDYLILKRPSASGRSGKWKDDDFDVLADGVVVGRIFNSAASPVGLPWMWTYGFNPLERQPTHGYAATREAAMAAFAKSWRRE